MKVDNLVGQRFGYLTVIARAPNTADGHAQWICKCDCGKTKYKPVFGKDLKRGKVVSCGCYHDQRIGNLNKSHGLAHTRLYYSWQDMRRRCERHPRYKNISVCDEWKEFEPFMQWALNNGYADDLTLDRIDNKGNYEPGNCRWATHKVQNNNKECCKYITIGGKTKTIAEWAEQYNIPYATLYRRIQCEWPQSEWFVPPRTIAHLNGRTVSLC